jgi:hypothetical protein
VAEMINFLTLPATPASPRPRSPELVRKGLRPLFEIASLGSKVFRMIPVLFSIWLLFPLFLMLTSDWIGLLIVFQAMTSAVCLQKTPAAKPVAACSSTSAPPNNVKGECRVL